MVALRPKAAALFFVLSIAGLPGRVAANEATTLAPAGNASLADSLPLETAAAPVAPAAAKFPQAAKPDPMLAAVMGAIPLMSGYYLTSSPQKGIIFTLADAVLMGAIYNVRRDDYLPDKDVGVYFAMLGIVNVADIVLSVMQARSDAAVTPSFSLNPHGPPVFGLAWRF